MYRHSLLPALLIFLANINSLVAQTTNSGQISTWVTKQDRSSLFQKQNDSITFRENARNFGPAIVIDDMQQFQSIDGFGFALTGGSAEHIMKMSKLARAALLKELFRSDGDNIGVSYLRLTIGASDLNSFVFSYNDLPDGETDYDLKKFNLSQDYKDVIPVLKEILAINPKIKILSSPWSAPTWMKTNNNAKAGSLKKECYDVYARYLVKYITAMKKEGVAIDAITIQNEPLNANNTPSMVWLVTDQATFIKENLGPAFKKAGLTTKIILFDHNLDRPDYPLALLKDPEISQYVDGSGFHLYGGDVSALNTVHMARPDKNVYFTEQMVVEKPNSPTINIAFTVKRLVIGTTRNWSRNVVLWNIAADSLNGPHTDNGGCSMCQGAITIGGDKVSRNIAYYTIAHAAKFVPPGSVRIFSTNTGDKTVNMTEDEERPGVFRATVIENAQVLPNVAFKTPEGKIVLIVANDTSTTPFFKIQYKGKFANIRLSPGSVGTYVW